VHDPASATWFGSPPVYDVAFFTGERFESWESGQQAALIQTGDITPARGAVDLRVRDRAPTPRTGAFSRIYRPSIEMQLGEGITTNSVPVVVPAGDQASVPQGNRYLGLFVPYGVWLPPAYDSVPKPVPLFVALHGLSQDHFGLVPEWANGGIDVPAITIFPLGHSESGFYQGPAELDALESMEDVQQHYPVDADRVYLTGLSMGGIGTYTVATHRPDLFAGAVPVVGPGSGMRDFLWPLPHEPVTGPGRDYVGIYRMGSFGREVLDNAINVPFRIFAGLVDPLSTVSFQEGDVARWEGLGYDYQHALFLNRSHEFLTPYVNTLYHQLLSGCTGAPVPGCDPSLDIGGRVRDPNPARVVYRSVPFHWYEELSDKLVFDGAYWVTDMRLRTDQDADDFALIDVTSGALGAKRRAPVAGVGPELRTFEPTGDDYRFQGHLWRHDPATTKNRLDLRAENLAAVTLDLTRMGLVTSSDITMNAVGDGPTALTLANGDWADGTVLRVLRDGAEVFRGVAEGGNVTFDLVLDSGEDAGAEYTVTVA
jgi:hypothetical protein